MVAVRRDMPLPAVRIRPMHDADLAAVAALEKSSYLFPWTEGIFRDCVRVGYVCRVLEIQSEIVGYGVLSAGAGEAHILNVCIADGCRCRGLGRHMMEHLLERARGYGVREAYLEVRPSNTTAIRLYQSMGFEQVGIRRGYYQASTGREDAVVLKLGLAEK
ncbi:MAG TPA: ribosomal protein S18-alanine N-acetyltransferase [Steroidobacteraceae bacterium]|nr:ribosomal protein S18-alanine N-acetyltransferase [Steroidobacteraceae bacterium]